MKLFRVALLVALCTASAAAADVSILVRDQTGAPVRATGEWRGAGLAARAIATAADGTWIGRNIAPGEYIVTIASPGFRAATQSIHVEGNKPVVVGVVLYLSAISTSLEVTDAPSALDSAARVARQVPRREIQEHTGTQVSRETIGLVSSQPGWILEADGVLHPRGAEYDTQFIVDGVPLLDNRSPGFAPSIDPNEVQSLTVWTSGYPAAFGRKLGGVVEVATKRDFVPGWHGSAEFETGSFRSAGTTVAAGDVTGSTSFAITAHAARTDRFLDPPAIENFTNQGKLGGLRASFAHEFGHSSHLRLTVHSGASEFDVPNELAQQAAGQHQQRRIGETAGQFAFQKVLSPNLLFDVRGLARSLTADLWSNPQATPIVARQARGIREGYAAASLTGHHGRHEYQAGADLLVNNIAERFRYSITDAGAFDPEVTTQFAFAGSHHGVAAAAYAQDRITLGPWTVSAGLRLDGYDFLVRRNAWSPRLAASWKLPRFGVVLHASYDRIFDTPALENLLLASSAAAQNITPVATGLPVMPGAANFYELGVSKVFGAGLHVDARVFRRNFYGFADDDVLLNTGISLPVSFASARVEGIEGSLQAPIGTRLLWALNYSNLSGTARGPITGGLFLENGAALLADRSVFRITQDQRNTVSTRLRCELSRHVWIATSAQYGSGLPVDLEPGDAATNDPRILERVNFERGRLRPAYSVDGQVGVTVFQREQHKARVQLTVANLSNNLNVINFAGAFSGTAIGQPRSFAVRTRYEF